MVNFGSMQGLRDPGAAVTLTERALLVAAIGAMAAILVAIIGVIATYFSNKRQARRDLYSKAVQAAVAWKEMLYRVRRRIEGSEPELINRFHDLQDDLSYFQAWICSDSKLMGRSYRRFVEGVKAATEPLIAEAWAENVRVIPGNATPDDEHPDLSKLLDSFLRDVRSHLSPFLWRKLGVWSRNRERK